MFTLTSSPTLCSQLDGFKKAGGALGIITAALAWYGSAASVINATWDRELLPLGLWVRPKAKVRYLGLECRVHSRIVAHGIDVAYSTARRIRKR